LETLLDTCSGFKQGSKEMNVIWPLFGLDVLSDLNWCGIDSRSLDGRGLDGRGLDGRGLGGVALMDVALMGVALMGVALMGVALIGMALQGLLSIECKLMHCFRDCLIFAVMALVAVVALMGVAFQAWTC
jgi:hypothetical protein